MGDILSQNEIDALLKQLSTGELDVKELQNNSQEKKIKNFDFSRPNKFSKEHIRTLHIIFENYSRIITNYFSGYLRAPVQIDVLECQALPYTDFNSSIPSPVILGVADFSPLPGSIIIEIDSTISFALIDRLLGGKGGTMEKVREFSEIEKAIMERIINQMLNYLREPWENIVQLRPRLERLETNPQFVQIISPNQSIALITLKSKIGDVEGMINICLPHLVIEPVMSKLSTKFWYMTEKEITSDTITALQDRISSVQVPLKAVLGSTTITVGEFLELQRGDVIQLDTQVNDELTVYVGDLLKFYGKPGVKKSKTAVQITRVVREEDE